jgi:hypothetical protein
MLVLRLLVLRRCKLLLTEWKLLIRQLQLSIPEYCHFLIFYLIPESRPVRKLIQQLLSCSILILSQHCNHLMILLASMTIKTLFFSPRTIQQRTPASSLSHLTSISSKLMRQLSVMSLSFPTSTTLHQVGSIISDLVKKMLIYASSTTLIEPIPSAVSIGKSECLLLPSSLHHSYIVDAISAYGAINTSRGPDSRSSNATSTFSSSSTIL